MKYLSISLFLLVCTFGAFAQSPVQKKDVPPAVLKSYLSQNSGGALDSNWTKESITLYKVHYTDNGQKYEAQYFPDGRWIKTTTETDRNSLPVVVQNRLKELYPGSRVLSASIELNNDGKFYVVELDKGNARMTVYFTMSGKLVY